MSCTKRIDYSSSTQSAPRGPFIYVSSPRAIQSLKVREGVDTVLSLSFSLSVHVCVCVCVTASLHPTIAHHTKKNSNDDYSQYARGNDL